MDRWDDTCWDDLPPTPVPAMSLLADAYEQVGFSIGENLRPSRPSLALTTRVSFQTLLPPLLALFGSPLFLSTAPRRAGVPPRYAKRLEPSRRPTHLPPTPTRPPPSTDRLFAIYVLRVWWRAASLLETMGEPAAPTHRSLSLTWFYSLSISKPNSSSHFSLFHPPPPPPSTPRLRRVKKLMKLLRSGIVRYCGMEMSGG